MFAVFLIVVSLSSVVFSAQIDITSDLSTNTATTDVLPCKTDRDCPETAYCFNVKIPVCVTCFDCRSRNRKNRIRCARGVLDCGDCLPGFMSDAYPHQRRWCKPENVETRAQPRMGNDTDELAIIGSKWMTVITICIFAILGFASYTWFHKRNYRRAVISNSANNEPSVAFRTTTTTATTTIGVPPPPSYRETMDLGEEDNVSCSFELRFSEHPVVDQKAIPYLGDDFSREHFCGHIQSTANSATSNNVAQTTPSETPAATSVNIPCNINIHDEDTAPSFWAPGENYGEIAQAAEDQTMQVETANNTLQPTKRKYSDDSDENSKKKKGG